MTDTTPTMSPTRLEYVARLWSTKLGLNFDGELLHLENGQTFTWKTGLEVEGIAQPTDRINKMTTNQQTSVRHILARIAEAWAKENPTKVLENAAI